MILQQTTMFALSMVGIWLISSGVAMFKKGKRDAMEEISESTPDVLIVDSTNLPKVPHPIVEENEALISEGNSPGMARKFLEEKYGAAKVCQALDNQTFLCDDVLSTQQGPL